MNLRKFTAESGLETKEIPKLKNQKGFSARCAILINKITVNKAVGTLITSREILTEILLASLSLFFYFLSLYFQFLPLYFQFLSLYFQFLSISFQFLSLYFYYDFCSFFLEFNEEARKRTLPRQT